MGNSRNKNSRGGFDKTGIENRVCFIKICSLQLNSHKKHSQLHQSLKACCKNKNLETEQNISEIKFYSFTKTRKKFLKVKQKTFALN